MAQVNDNAEREEVSRQADKSRKVAILLAAVVGFTGAHKYYLGEEQVAKLYILTCWAGIPFLVGWLDAANYLILKRGDKWEEYLEEENMFNKVDGGGASLRNEEKEEKASVPANYIEEAKDNYVTKERILKVRDILDDGETVYYLTRGSTVDVEGSSAGTSLFGDDRSRKSGTKDGSERSIRISE